MDIKKKFLSVSVYEYESNLKAAYIMFVQLSVSLGPVGRSAGTDVHGGKKGMYVVSGGDFYVSTTVLLSCFFLIRGICGVLLRS